MNNVQLDDNQLSQLMRRFRNKKDLYRYLDSNLVSDLIHCLINLLFNLASAPPQAESLLSPVPPVDLVQPEAPLLEEPGQEPEGTYLAWIVYFPNLGRSKSVPKLLWLHAWRVHWEFKDREELLLGDSDHSGTWVLWRADQELPLIASFSSCLESQPAKSHQHCSKLGWSTVVLALFVQ